ncbi:putative Class V protein [Seiridium cardinale]|uniref:Class V protein n=1 Tax=Seiridium cardinale TaxID=138064 RepID=A0ABR2XRL4_9PEZI
MHLLTQVAWIVAMVPISYGLNLSSHEPEPASRDAAWLARLGAVPDRLLLGKRADTDTCDLDLSTGDPPTIPADTPDACDNNACTSSGIFWIPTSVPTLLPSSTIRQKRGISSTAGIGGSLAVRAPRGVSEPQPLAARTGRSTVARQNNFIINLHKDANKARIGDDNTENGGHVGILPGLHQIDRWKATATIEGKTTQFPIGMTAEWYEFGNQRANWYTYGLSGCTMMIIVSQHGFWAGHLWESTKTTINGASAFLRRLGTGPQNTTPRSKEEFAACAIDPLTQTLPADVRNFVSYISLADLKTDKGDPFHEASDVEIYIMTRSKSPTDKSLRYADRISELQDALIHAIPGFNENNLKVGTYIGAGDPNPVDGVTGTISFQYSPYHAKKQGDECTPLAGFRVWVENQLDPKIEKIWEALPSQKSSNKKRDAWTSTGTITQAPSKTPSCSYLPMDPDQGRTVAACVCESKTLPLLTPKPTGTKSLFFQSESCQYTSMPGTPTNPITTKTETWTSNCQACTLVGGIAGKETCTTVSNCIPTKAPSPTIAAWVGNLSTIDIGNAEDGNGGKDLAKEMFTKLRGFCDDKGCKSNQNAVMDNVEAIIQEGEEPLKPAMYLQEAQYSSTKVLEQMLSVGISSWIATLNNEQLKLCKEVDYEAEADETGSGCGTGPISPSRLRRKTRRDTGQVLWERGSLALEERQLLERCKDDCGSNPKVCHYAARMCSAPNEITVVMANGADPYGNRLNIGVQLETIGDGFLCEEAVGALTAVVAVLAPELLEADALEGVELEAICGILKDPQGALTSYIGGRAVPTAS